VYLSRRDFHKFAFGALPLSTVALPGRLRAAPNSNFAGVQIGVITYSFKDDIKKPEGIIPSLLRIGLNSVELMSDDCERLAGAPPITSFVPPEKLEPAQRARVDEEWRHRILWRKAATAATFERVLDVFQAAGIRLDTLCYNMYSAIEDDEIDFAFRMARALRVHSISCSSTLAVARRVAPFAEKYRIIWAGHNHADVHSANEIASLESFDSILSFGRYMGVNLDVGHMTAANLDPLAFIRQHHSRITNLHLKDRKKNNGPNMPWGLGDTPISEILRLTRQEKYTFDANIELEYPIPAKSNSAAEVAKCLAFAKRCLES
jgi:sugar phosphate isomerase/epimerase